MSQKSYCEKKFTLVCLGLTKNIFFVKDYIDVNEGLNKKTFCFKSIVLLVAFKS